MATHSVFQSLHSKIILLRGHKFMLSTDLADLYVVAPKVLVQAVKRHLKRFPEDFMFQLSLEELQILKSQIVTSSWGGLRKPPYAFTPLALRLTKDDFQYHKTRKGKVTET